MELNLENAIKGAKGHTLVYRKQTLVYVRDNKYYYSESNVVVDRDKIITGFYYSHNSDKVVEGIV